MSQILRQLLVGGCVAGGESGLKGEAGDELLATIPEEEIVRRERTLGLALWLGPCPALVGGGGSTAGLGLVVVCG